MFIQVNYGYLEMIFILFVALTLIRKHGHPQVHLEPLYICHSFTVVSYNVRTEICRKEEVKKISTQGVEQSDLLRNASAERTNPPLSAPSSYF